MTNEELFPLVAAKDHAARNAMIEANMPLVTFKVDAYLKMFPQLEYLRDDLVGEGNLGLVQAVDRIRDGVATSDSNITGYLSTTIQTKLGDTIDGELYSSDRTARRDRLNGDEPRRLHKVLNSDHVIGELEFDPSKEAELLEMILGCCESDEERAIVDLRQKGYVDAEIARQLDLPLTTTFMLRRELYQRVLDTGEVTAD